MAIERWDPFREMVSLREAMNSLLQDSFVRPGSAMVPGVGAALPLDIAETENEFIVHASLPGVNPDEVQITVHGDTLTIRGETRGHEEKKGENWHLRERRFGAFQRSVALNAPVDSEKAKAEFEHGVLTLTLPKAEAAKPKQIKVSTGAGNGAGTNSGKSQVGQNPNQGPLNS
jgi:HSP20 family protein